MKPLAWSKADVIFLVIAAAFLYLNLFTIRGVPFFFEEDHLIFIHDAWRMSRGEHIYHDFIQFTFPGTQVLYLLLLELIGNKFWIINFVIFLQGMSGVALCLAISKFVFDDKWLVLLPASLFLFFGFRWFGLDGSHRLISPLFLYAAALILMSGRTHARIAMAGFCCGLSSFVTQPRGLVGVTAIAGFIVFETIRNRTSWKNLLFDEVLLVGSYAIALLLMLSPFIYEAGLSNFLDQTVFQLSNYMQDPTANYGAYQLLFEYFLSKGVLASVVTVFYYALIPLVYIVCLVFFWRRNDSSEILLLCLLGIALGLGTVAPTPGRLFHVAIPALVILVWLASKIQYFRSTFWPKLAVVALMFLGSVLAMRNQTNWKTYDLNTPTGEIAFLSPEARERYQWLGEHTRPGDLVFEVYQPAVNFVLQTPNPTRVTFLLDTGATPDRQVSEAIDDLKKASPAYILWDGRWSKAASERTPADRLEPLYEHLRQYYVLEKSFTPYSHRDIQVWKLDTAHK